MQQLGRFMVFIMVGFGCPTLAGALPPPAVASPPGAAAQPPKPAAESPILEEPIAQPGPARLSGYERSVLRRGRLSTGRYVGGGLLGTWMGFGVGHAIQGRYGESGLIFTLGQSAGLAMLVAGVINVAGPSTCFEQRTARRTRFVCVDDSRNENLWIGSMITGAIVLTGLRIWEIADLWITPRRENAEYDRVRGRNRGGLTLSFMPVPVPGGGMAALGGRF